MEKIDDESLKEENLNISELIILKEIYDRDSKLLEEMVENLEKELL